MNSSTKRNSSSDRKAWFSGFTPQAELLNGRLAMIGFIAMLLTELMTGQGVLHYWSLM